MIDGGSRGQILLDQAGVRLIDEVRGILIADDINCDCGTLCSHTSCSVTQSHNQLSKSEDAHISIYLLFTKMFTQLHLQMWYLNFIQDNKLFYKNIQLFNFCVLKIFLLCAIKIDTQFIN